MSSALKDCVIALEGDFGLARTEKRLKRWIEMNGGVFSAVIRDHVTHLVCSQKAWVDKTERVQVAKSLRGVAVVSYDWLEDGLLEKKYHHSKRYRLARVVRDRQARSLKRKQKRAQHRKELKSILCKEYAEVTRDTGHENYVVYRDPQGFPYDVVLTRVNIATNSNERHVLKLCQTTDVPYYYASYGWYFSKDSNSLDTMYPPAPNGSTFEDALTAFKRYFKQHTRREWEQRMLPGKEMGAFAYRVPIIGPLGWDIEVTPVMSREAVEYPEPLHHGICASSNERDFSCDASRLMATPAGADLHPLPYR